MRKLLKSRKGFTLIELLVVIAVIAVLSGVVLVAIDPLEQIDRAKDADLKNKVGQVANAAQAAFTASGVTGSAAYPAQLGTGGQQNLKDGGELKAEIVGVNYTSSGSTMSVYAQLASKQSRRAVATGCAAPNVPYYCFYASTTTNGQSTYKCAAANTNPSCP